MCSSLSPNQTVKYTRFPEFLDELTYAKQEDIRLYQKLMKRYRKFQVLIIDEWLLYSVTEVQISLLLGLIEGRTSRTSTIFCSQFAIDG